MTSKRGWVNAAAQLVAARTFNEKSGVHEKPVFGCVTSGEAWQFLRLMDTVLEVDRHRYYWDNLGGVLAALLHSIPIGHPLPCLA